MKVILENLIRSITSTHENRAFPASRVLNSSPQDVFRANTNHDVITLDCGGPFDTLAIFNTNADSVIIESSDPGLVVWDKVACFADTSGSLLIEEVANGSFDDGLDGWTVGEGYASSVSVSGGTLTLDAAMGEFPYVSQVLTLADGLYEFSKVCGNPANIRVTFDGEHLPSGGCIRLSGTGELVVKNNSGYGAETVDSVSLQRYDETIEWHESTEGETETATQQIGNTSFWHDFSESTKGGAKITLNMTCPPGEILYCGAIVVGIKTTVTDPQHGLTEGLVDYSIHEQLMNGADYYRDRERVRMFQGQMTVSRSDAFYVFMRDFAKKYGKVPKAWKITELSGDEWAVFARLQDMPGGSHNYPAHSIISFSLIEVI